MWTGRCGGLLDGFACFVVKFDSRRESSVREHVIIRLHFAIPMLLICYFSSLLTLRVVFTGQGKNGANDHKKLK